MTHEFNGGIHWRFGQDAGNDLGRAIATEIYKNQLRSVHGRPSRPRVRTEPPSRSSRYGRVVAELLHAGT